MSEEKHCVKHIEAFKDWGGLRNSENKFRVCKKCGWIIRKPASDKFWESLKDDL